MLNRSTQDNYQRLLGKLQQKNILPADLDADISDQYVHKSVIGHTESLLITKKANQIVLFELVHHGSNHKKTLLAKSVHNDIRLGINVKTGLPVAIWVYPFYAKKSALKFFRPTDIAHVQQGWELLTALDVVLPQAVVASKYLIAAGDKSTTAQNKNKLVYVVTDCYNQTLDAYLSNENNSIDDIKKVLIKLFGTTRDLFRHAVTWFTGNFSDVVLDADLNPRLVNPDGLHEHTLTNGMIGFQIGINYSLLRFIGARFLITPDGDHHYLKTFATSLTSYIHEGREPVLKQALDNFFDAIELKCQRQQALCIRGCVMQ